MQKSQHHEHGWVICSFDSSVEYQIDSDCLRIRRWQNGTPKISEWAKWDVSTEATIRKHLRALAWEALPQHQQPAVEETRGDTGHGVMPWLRSRLPHPFQR